jgi:hypothetical protein
VKTVDGVTIVEGNKAVVFLISMSGLKVGPTPSTRRA